MRVYRKVRVERKITMQEFKRLLGIPPTAEVTIGAFEWVDDYHYAGDGAEVLLVVAEQGRHTVRQI